MVKYVENKSLPSEYVYIYLLLLPVSFQHGVWGDLHHMRWQNIIATTRGKTSSRAESILYTNNLSEKICARGFIEVALV